MEKQKTKKKPKKVEPKPLNKEEWVKKIFGKIKGFGDGMEYQNMIRHGHK